MEYPVLRHQGCFAQHYRPPFYGTQTIRHQSSHQQPQIYPHNLEYEERLIERMNPAANMDTIVMKASVTFPTAYWLGSPLEDSISTVIYSSRIFHPSRDGTAHHVLQGDSPDSFLLKALERSAESLSPGAVAHASSSAQLCKPDPVTSHSWPKRTHPSSPFQYSDLDLVTDMNNMHVASTDSMTRPLILMSTC
ncbi:hypothetical protein EDC04DRAFT_2608914 [Pisolithus marmoratus]|nr:hypothetical protein EDC04DRAFT_2608914 [Pisolithus marmoratus]